MIPGVSGTGVPSDVTRGLEEGTMAQSEVEQVARFTNPQGVYNTFWGRGIRPRGTSGMGSIGMNHAKRRGKPLLLQP